MKYQRKIANFKKFWLPGDGGDEYLWSEDIEKPQKHRRTPAKVRSDAPESLKRQPSLSLRERAVAFASDRGTLRTKDFEAIGVPRHYLAMMCNEGLLDRVSYGRYRIAKKSK